MTVAFLVPAAQAQVAPTVVSTVEQNERDDERSRILRAELEKEQAALMMATQRKAERQAAGDLGEIEIAERRRLSHSSSIDALRRELGLLDRDARAAPSAPKPATVTAVRRQPAERPDARQAPDAPWWDIYARLPKRNEAVQRPVSLVVSPAAGTTDALR